MLFAYTIPVMLYGEALQAIRTDWEVRVLNQFAHAKDPRGSFRAEIARFYEHLVQALESGDAADLYPILDSWLNDEEIDFSDQEGADGAPVSLPFLLDTMLLNTFASAKECLDPYDALSLLGSILPVYASANQYLSQKETEKSIERATEELHESQRRIERLEKSKSDFISIAAHELKTPLTLIEGYTSMLREQIPVLEENPQWVLLMKGIDNGSRRLREIVEDMIDVSIIDNNLLSLNFQPLWVSRILQVIEHEFADTVRQRSLKLEIRRFPGSDDLTYGDNERLYQAFRNLVSNAIKYTPDGGRILVDGRRLASAIEVTVRDSGIGIDPKDHQSIFEKFGRVGNSSNHSSGKTKFKGGGPGLGLPICKGIIEAHGGRIWVESSGYDEENCPGTVFHVLLPLHSKPPETVGLKYFAHLEQRSQKTE